MSRFTISLACLMLASSVAADDTLPSADAVLRGLRDFYARTAKTDGSFTPGVDPHYRGMSDSAYSDLAAVTYACTLHRTFGWKLPHEEKTSQFLLSRQRKTGEFFNVAGTVDPNSAEGKTYNTTQGLVALRALGVPPRYFPLTVFEDILKQDYKTLPAYSTSFFPLAYLCYGKAIPEQADRAIRDLMIQDDTGYLNNHIAATFHASHYYRLIGETTPRSHEMIARILRDQKADGSWMLNMPSRDRHATFDAVFTLRHEGHPHPHPSPPGGEGKGVRGDCKKAIERAVHWALSCRNPDGGFGHFPGSTSDADAVYFQVGVLVMGGFLKPAEPLPKDAHLLSWGHLMPLPKTDADAARLRLHLDGWVAAVAFSPDGQTLAAGSSDNKARLWNISGKEVARLEGHTDYVAAVTFSPDGKRVATGSYDRTARIWDVAGKQQHVLREHRGAVVSVAFSPDGKLLATASVDGNIRLWDAASGEPVATLVGHRSWVNAVAFGPPVTPNPSPPGGEGRLSGALVSGSSDGTIKIWSLATRQEERTIQASNAEVRSVAVSPDGSAIAAGIRYGVVKIWDVGAARERLSIPAHHGDAWAVAFAADGKTLVSGGGDWNRPGFVKTWDATTGRLLDQRQHTGEVLGIALSPQNSLVAAGGGDNTVIVWPARKPGSARSDSSPTSSP